MLVTLLSLLFTQDYTEEFRDIAKGTKSKEAIPAGSITLINQRPVGEDLHVKFYFFFNFIHFKKILIVHCIVSGLNGSLYRKHNGFRMTRT